MCLLHDCSIWNWQWSHQHMGADTEYIGFPMAGLVYHCHVLGISHHTHYWVWWYSPNHRSWEGICYPSCPHEFCSVWIHHLKHWINCQQHCWSQKDPTRQDECHNIIHLKTETIPWLGDSGAEILWILLPDRGKPGWRVLGIAEETINRVEGWS